jgi:hypothetical protein
VRNEDTLQRSGNRGKTNWIGHIFPWNGLPKHIIQGKLQGRIEETGRWGRRRKNLLDDIKEKRGCWKLKEEALDCPLRRIRFGRGYGPVTS